MSYSYYTTEERRGVSLSSDSR